MLTDNEQIPVNGEAYYDMDIKLPTHCAGSVDMKIPMLSLVYYITELLQY